MWVAEGVTEIRQRVEQVPLLPLGPSPTYSVTAQGPALPCPGEHLRLRPFKQQKHQDKKKKMAQMTEHFKAPEKIQLSDEEIANLSDAQFKTLVIKMLTELVESIRKPDEKMKPMLRETKENVQGTNSDAKETGTQIKTVWTRRKKETSNQKTMKKQELGKMRRGLGTSRTS